MILFKGGEVQELKNASERKTQFSKKGKVDAAMANKIAKMYNDDFSYSEIAKECGVSAGTIAYTIKTLRKCRSVEGGAE